MHRNWLAHYIHDKRSGVLVLQVFGTCVCKVAWFKAA